MSKYLYCKLWCFTCNESKIPPMKTAKNRFSTGAKGSWMPNNIELILNVIHKYEWIRDSNNALITWSKRRKWRLRSRQENVVQKSSQFSCPRRRLRQQRRKPSLGLDLAIITHPIINQQAHKEGLRNSTASGVQTPLINLSPILAKLSPFPFKHPTHIITKYALGNILAAWLTPSYTFLALN